MRNLPVLLVFALLVSGCATHATLSPTDELPVGNGVVILRLSANAQNFGFFQYWNELTITQVGVEQPANFLVGLSRKGNARSAVYLGTLPPGRYRPVRLSSEQCGAICVSSTITFNEAIGEFEVEAGRTTDLGHVVYEEVAYKKVMIVRGETLISWIPSYMSEYYENIPQSAVQPPYLGWSDPPEQEKRRKLAYDRVRLTSNGLLRPEETADGSMLFGSLLGMVKQWNPGESMRYHDTGLQGAVESVVEVSPQTWLAGGETGRLRITRDGGTSWSDFGSGFPYRSIAGLHVYGERVFATVSTKDTLAIYSTTIDAPAWTEHSSHALEFSFWTGIPIFPESFLHENFLITSLPSNGLVVTNLDTLDSQVRTFPGSIHKFAVGADGVLRCMCTKALFNNPWKSEDLGETWTASGHDRYMWVPHFTDASNGFSILKGKTMATSDGGLTWLEAGPAPEYANQLGHFSSSGDLFATDGFYFIYRSSDGGETWERR